MAKAAAKTEAAAAADLPEIKPAEAPEPTGSKRRCRVSCRGVRVLVQKGEGEHVYQDYLEVSAANEGEATAEFLRYNGIRVAGDAIQVVWMNDAPAAA